MAVFETFSKRQKKKLGVTDEVYSYNEIPTQLRVQIIHIIEDTIGVDKGMQKGAFDAYEYMHQILCKEFGVFRLSKRNLTNAADIREYFLECENHEHCLDIIELAFKIIEIYVGDNYNNYKHYTTSKQHPTDAITELNARFKEHGIGYEYISKELIRVDSQFLHAEAVKPALKLLNSNVVYEGANEEFLSAHEHFRHQRFKECLVESLKSLESLMKGICLQHSWECEDNFTAKNLINVCINEGLIPLYMQNQFASLRTLLESGVPTLRNKKAGHGQGAEVINIPEHLASYALHLTATNLIFLMRCNEQLNIKS
jgi:hypothetical protein